MVAWLRRLLRRKDDAEDVPVEVPPPSPKAKEEDIKVAEENGEPAVREEPSTETNEAAAKAEEHAKKTVETPKTKKAADKPNAGKAKPSNGNRKKTE